MKKTWINIIAGIVGILLIIILYITLMSNMWGNYVHDLPQDERLVEKWVHLKVNGEIIQGNVYGEKNRTKKNSPNPKNQISKEAEDGLILTSKDSSHDGKKCTRTYRFQNKLLNIEDSNDNFTEGYVSYIVNNKLNLWGEIPLLYHRKETSLDGEILSEVNEWIPILGKFNKQFYRISECTGLFIKNTENNLLIPCYFSLNLFYNIYSGLQVSQNSAKKWTVKHYSHGQLVVEHIYNEPFPEPNEPIKKQKQKINTFGKQELEKLRIKFKKDLNIKNDRLETCSYWFK